MRRLITTLWHKFLSYVRCVPLAGLSIPFVGLMHGALTVVLLFFSNVFMTLAWYGHLKFKSSPILERLGLLGIILFSWGLAFFEYMLQVPANRIGYKGNGGPFDLYQLKIIQELITILVFVFIVRLLFQNETLRWNHIVALGLVFLAVVFAFWGHQ